MKALFKEYYRLLRRERKWAKAYFAASFAKNDYKANIAYCMLSTAMREAGEFNDDIRAVHGGELVAKLVRCCRPKPKRISRIESYMEIK